MELFNDILKFLIEIFINFFIKSKHKYDIFLSAIVAGAAVLVNLCIFIKTNPFLLYLSRYELIFIIFSLLMIILFVIYFSFFYFYFKEITNLLKTKK